MTRRDFVSKNIACVLFKGRVVLRVEKMLRLANRSVHRSAPKLIDAHKKKKGKWLRVFSHLFDLNNRDFEGSSSSGGGVL